MWQLERKKWQEYLEKNNPEMLEEMNGQNETEAMEAFAGKMAFGTGGLRSVLGVGPARMNIYTVVPGNDRPTIDMSVHNNFLLLLDYP